MDAAKPSFPGRAKRVALFSVSQSPGDSATSARDGTWRFGAGGGDLRAPKVNIRTTWSRKTMATAAVHRIQLHFLWGNGPGESALMVDWARRRFWVAAHRGHR